MRCTTQGGKEDGSRMPIFLVLLNCAKSWQARRAPVFEHERFYFQLEKFPLATTLCVAKTLFASCTGVHCCCPGREPLCSAHLVLYPHLIVSDSS